MADKANTGIYEIVNLINGKRYIGSAAIFRTRFAVHRHHLRRGNHHSIPLQRSWLKYGESSFLFRRLLFCRLCDLIMYEQAAIDAFKPEYNICKVAGNCLGVKWSDEARARHSILQKANPTFRGRKHSAETLAKMSESQKGNPSPTKGKKRKPDAVAKTAAAHRGMKRSSQTRAKISSALTGSKKPPRSLEYRLKISTAHKGRQKAPEHMAALQEGRRNRIYTEEQRAKISSDLLEQYASGARRRERSPEYRAKISAALRGRKLTPEHRANVAAAMRGKTRGPYTVA